MVASGEWVLVDIRPVEDYEESHIPESVNVSLFQKITPSNITGGDILKTLLLASQGVTPMKTNKTFPTDVKVALQGKKAIVACEAGGTLTASTGFRFGKSSRSLTACYQLLASKTVRDRLHREKK